VLVLVVSVAASGAFLRIVSVERNWKNSYKSQLDRADVASVTAGNVQIALTNTQAELAKVKGACTDHQTAITKGQADLAAEKAANAQAMAVVQGNFDSLKASLTELQEALDASLAMKKQLLTEKATLAEAVETANATARGLKKSLDEASVQITRLESMARHYVLLIKDLQAEKAEMQLKIERGATVAASGQPADGAPTVAAGAGQAVSGKVTAVHDGVASINIGRAKGIREKMMLTVHRGGKFVSHLRIDLVEPDSAAGVILDKKLDVMQGDNVATSLK
jgi:uncharacterized phage infection (PIP) family protein YhgE